MRGTRARRITVVVRARRRPARPAFLPELCHGGSKDPFNGNPEILLTATCKDRVGQRHKTAQRAKSVAFWQCFQKEMAQCGDKGPQREQAILDKLATAAPCPGPGDVATGRRGISNDAAVDA